MARGRRREEWSRWATWFAIYAECHRDSKRRSAAFTPNDFLPDEFRVKRQPTEPAAKMSLRQFAAAMGQPIADEPTIIRSESNGTGTK